MKTNKDYTLNYTVANISYGEITVPKGTSLTHQTASGIDKNHHFVNEYGWIEKNYADIASLLIHDVKHYGIDVPKEYVEY